MSVNMFKSLLAAVLLLVFSNAADAGPPRRAGRAYPLVYGSTGRPYGPTQSHYQYQLRYGRPWHGAGRSVHRSYYAGRSHLGPAYIPAYSSLGSFHYYGLTTPIYATPNVIYTGSVYPQFGYYGAFGLIPGVPVINHVPYQNGAIGPTMIGRGFQPDPFLLPNDPPVNNILPNNEQNKFIEPTPIVEESTPLQRERALRLRVLGDEAFAKIDYREAGERYREAMKATPDLADPRYRLAISLAARARFEEAVEQLKIATELDIDWPSSGVTLDQMYGLQDPNDWMKRDEKNRIKTRIAEWTNRDVRDPNRLFLLSVVMMLDGDVRAKELLETAVRINGVERHLIAFLSPLMSDPITVQDANQRKRIEPMVIEPGQNKAGFVPPAPERIQNRGEITGAERDRRVFEKSQDPIPPLPELLKTSSPPKPLPPEPNPPTQNPTQPDSSEIEAEPSGPVLPPLP